jgi:hypothetical protein
LSGLGVGPVRYKKKCKPVRFETAPEQSGVVLIRGEFDSDRMVEAFRRAFDPSTADLDAI